MSAGAADPHYDCDKHPGQEERAAWLAAKTAPKCEPPCQEQTAEKIQRDFERARSVAPSGKRTKNRKSSPVRSGNQQSPRAFCSYCNKGLAKRIDAKSQAAAAIKEFDRNEEDQYDEQYD
ncbi:hypothetical protein HDU87_000028 [Geranomyces variabilis]|uniref:Uncharacterized protein n=1 Tax=Geranomyces variabilis TaxID=109894 RepID=A0AAD5TRW2_9FUNG|nr:hypothetical protein HDU87_000028 [Geranomyces variabilis]